MAKLPKEIKLTRHAQQRLAERKNSNNNYNTKNLMRSTCKWYGKDDLIKNSALYLHCLYVCRKSKQMGYITDGNLEVVYNKGTGVAITIMEVKEKFLPITQYIKPEYLKQIEIKKEQKKMMKKIEINTNTTICPDCGKEVAELTSQWICERCRTRKSNARSRHKEYRPYISLTEKEKAKIDRMQTANSKSARLKRGESIEDIEADLKQIPIPTPKIPIVENYYEAKATQNPVTIQATENQSIQTTSLNQGNFIDTLKKYNCELSEDILKDIMQVLIATDDKFKNIFMTAIKNSNKNAILNLEQELDIIEKKLQNDWESNGFQEADDIRFKNFLTTRKSLKESILFWKQLYQIGSFAELQKNENKEETIQTSTDDAKTTNKFRLKKYQVSTESISTILNTRRPFSRVFYATSKEQAYSMFVKWMSERQLHEDKDKTNIIELEQEDWMK